MGLNRVAAATGLLGHQEREESANLSQVFSLGYMRNWHDQSLLVEKSHNTSLSGEDHGLICHISF